MDLNLANDPRLLSLLHFWMLMRAEENGMVLESFFPLHRLVVLCDEIQTGQYLSDQRQRNTNV
jgi:hypothetical protein